MIESVLWLAVGAFTTVCSLAFLFRAHTRVDAAHNWPVAQGTVLYAAIDHGRDGDGAAFRPRLTYRYSVGDRVFLGRRIQFGAEASFDHERKAREVLERYPEGRQLRVRYDPRRPEEAVLEVRLDTAGYWFMAAAGALIAFAGWQGGPALG